MHFIYLFVQRTQALADQAWEKVRMTGSVQQGLEAECAHLRTQFSQCQKEHDTLLATCALLSGALYPMYLRYTELSSQRQLLVNQLGNFATFKHQIQALVKALSGDGLQKQKNGTGSRRGLLRFRKAVLAVVVANRLVNASQSNCKMFSATDALPGVYSMMVCSGYVEPITKKFSGNEILQLQFFKEISQVNVTGLELDVRDLLMVSYGSDHP